MRVFVSVGLLSDRWRYVTWFIRIYSPHRTNQCQSHKSFGSSANAPVMFWLFLRVQCGVKVVHSKMVPSQTLDLVKRFISTSKIIHLLASTMTVTTSTESKEIQFRSPYCQLSCKDAFVGMSDLAKPDNLFVILTSLFNQQNSQTGKLMQIKITE